ncbi:PQQ-binding-like beta-propeller repeat protein [Catellatospora vulcania]|uniref:PQQ-binding-like beta-propeller repeat protein n=1 Tax=Catellatospora vulcania TaxID=1460450 RepID=UPI0012D4809B|nr:PQQ-binding-like beta-propeller repeat protein [Catellatospora vulcania]
MEREIIELGAGWAHPEPYADLPRPARHFRALATAVALLLTGALGAATPVPRPLAEVAVLALGGADGVFSGTVDPVRDLLVVRADGALSAYALDDGSPRWRSPYPTGRHRDLRVPPEVPDVALVVEDFESGASSSTVVDLNTGAVRWSVSEYVWFVGRYALESPPFVVHGSFDEAGGVPTFDPAEMTVRDLDTGRVRWVLRGTPFASVDETTREAWSISEQGDVTVYDLRDGRVLRTGRVAFPPGGVESASVYGGKVVLSARLPDGSYLEARYDSRTLSPLPTVPEPVRFTCGGYLCQVGDDSSGRRTPLAVLDRDTLAVRHRLPADVDVLPSAQGAITVRPTGSARLGVPADRLIDLADGRTLRDLTGWEVQLAFDDSREALLMRSARDGVQVARIEDGEVRLLGTLPAGLQRCFHTRQRIACVYDGKRLGLWSIAPRTS